MLGNNKIFNFTKMNILAFPTSKKVIPKTNIFLTYSHWGSPKALTIFVRVTNEKLFFYS
jgi:hypothetical protein